MFPNSIQYIISTDGAPLPSGTKKGFWPLQIVLVDLDKKLRYKTVLLAWIMVNDHEPKPELMNLFIDMFNEQAKLLHTEGFSFVTCVNGISEEYHCRLIHVCIVADSKAKPVLQFRFQYNGYYGCSYCYQLEIYCNSVKYPFIDAEPESRTHNSHMEDVLHAKLKKSSVRGVKGRSSFCDFTTIDMIWSFVLNAMHNAILGVVVQLWVKLITPLQRREIDDLLQKLRPPPRFLSFTWKNIE